MPRRALQPRSLEREVYTALREEILGGGFAPGDPLVELQLAADLGVSKTPVREALIRLQRDGLVEIVPYRGARVSMPSAEEIREACEMRAWIESNIARKLAETRPPQLIRELEANVAAAQRALRTGERPAYLAAVREFSELLLAASDNRYAKDVLARLRNLLGIIANASRATPGREKRSISEHRAIYRAIAAGHAEEAEEATRLHLASIARDSVQALERFALERLDEGAASGGRDGGR